MTSAHTMSPGRIVHWFPGRGGVGRGQCQPAILEWGECQGSRVVASLIPFTSGFQPVTSMREVERAVPTTITTDSWHWSDECPFGWPETD
jgi:hypothetical protein